MNLEPGLLDLIIKTLGAPGIIIICMGGPSLVMAFMYADHRRYERERLEAAKADGLRQAQMVEERSKVEVRHQEEVARLDHQPAGQALRNRGPKLREQYPPGRELTGQ